MLDTQVTVVGNVVTDPKLTMTKDKQPFTTFRIASTPRRFDRGTGEWRDGDTSFLSVICWRGLAENTATCLKRGQAVIVVGRLSIRQYETKDGEKRQSAEIDAAAIGPDLGRVVAIIRRAERSMPAVSDGAADTGVPGTGAEDLGDEEQFDVDGLHWSDAGPDLDAGSGLDGGSGLVTGLGTGSGSEVTGDDEEQATPTEPELPVLVGAGGRPKGRSH